MTLAYVFWHWPKPGGAREVYETRLGMFHDALAAHPPRGFERSAALRVSGAPWTGAAEAYEDWYLIDGFAALGEINEAAVSGARQRPHDEVAVEAGGGTAGVYRLIAGAGDVAAARVSYWMAKPAGMTYAAFREALGGALASPGTSLWQRQMTLGPATEFCLQAPGAAAAPEAVSATVVRVELTWPRG